MEEENVLSGLVTALRAQKVSGRGVRLVERLLKRLGSAEAFEKASPGDILAAYRLERPKSTVDVGRDGWATIEKARSWLRATRRGEKAFAEASAKAVEAGRLKEAEEAARAEAEKARLAAEEAARNPVFTKAQVKALADFMELASIESVDLVKARAFVEAFKVEGCGKEKA